MRAGFSTAFNDDYIAILKINGIATLTIDPCNNIVTSSDNYEWIINIGNIGEFDVTIYKDINGEEISSDIAKSNILISYDKVLCQAMFIQLPEISVECTDTFELEDIKDVSNSTKILLENACDIFEVSASEIESREDTGFKDIDGNVLKVGDIVGTKDGKTSKAIVTRDLQLKFNCIYPIENMTWNLSDDIIKDFGIIKMGSWF